MPGDLLAIREIEDAYVAHWSGFGRWTLGELHDENGVLRFETLYGMMTLPEARGRGVASGMTTVLLAQAKELGCRRIVLQSSDMALGVYRRAGFVQRCRFTVFATAPWRSAGSRASR